MSKSQYLTTIPEDEIFDASINKDKSKSMPVPFVSAFPKDKSSQEKEVSPSEPPTKTLQRQSASVNLFYPRK